MVTATPGLVRLPEVVAVRPAIVVAGLMARQGGMTLVKKAPVWKIVPSMLAKVPEEAYAK